MANPMSSTEGLGDIDANRNSEIYGGSVVLIVLPTIFVGLRLLSRWMARANLWWDDYVVIMALIFSWGPNILSLAGTHVGFGRHLYTLPLPSVIYFFKHLYAFELLYIFAMSSVKYSIILFQYRIFPIVQYRRLLLLLTIFTTCLTISSTLVCIFQCIPISGFWTTFAGFLEGAKCVNVVRFILIAGGVNATTDFVLLALPIPLLWKLRTGTLQKLILTGIFTMGLTVCSVSIVRLVLVGRFSPDDITWTYVPPAIWTAAEPSIGVISACLPSLRPLFTKLVWGRTYRPKMLSRSSNSNGLTSSGGWRSGGYLHDVKGDRKPQSNSSLNRLRDGSAASGEHGMVSQEEPWRHKAYVSGGRSKGDDLESVFEVEEDGGNESINGIRVKTTVTVTEAVDWLDDLY